MLSLANESALQIQIGEAISIMAKADFPENWEGLIEVSHVSVSVSILSRIFKVSLTARDKRVRVSPGASSRALENIKFAAVSLTTSEARHRTRRVERVDNPRWSGRRVQISSRA